MSETNLKEKMSKIKMIILDVDGTMTDGRVYYSKNGEELKRFSIRDGMGIELLRKGEIGVGIITSENSPIVTARAAKLKIEPVLLGSRNKKKDLLELSEKIGIDIDNIAFVGDDINDLQALETAGFSACPADSAESVRNIADFVSSRNGGDGAVREIAEKILESQNKSITLPEQW